MNPISTEDRIAQHSGFKTFKEQLEAAKLAKVKFEIPPYIIPGQVVSLVYMRNLFADLRNQGYGFFFNEETDEVFIGLNKQEDSSEAAPVL